MADPKGGAMISVGAQTYLKKWLLGDIYGRRPAEISTNATTKGNAVEPKAIEYANEFLAPDEFWAKNERRYQNDHIIGTPDVVTSTAVIDMKSPFSHETFPLLETALPNKDYYWQMQGYMALTGLPRAFVVYVLCDAPEEMIYAEAKRRAYQRGLGADGVNEVYDETHAEMSYPDLPDHLRIKSFEISRDDAAIEKINLKVEACREWLSQFDQIQSV
jgi:hypothetical protein